MDSAFLKPNYFWLDLHPIPLEYKNYPERPENNINQSDLKSNTNTSSERFALLHKL